MNITSISLRLAVLGALALTAVACGGDEEATPSPEPTPEAAAFTVDALEFKYEPVDEWTIPSGGSTTFELVNKGVVEHDFTIDELDFQILANVGETVTGTLTDPAAGTYKVYCTIPGHEAAGMVGTLVVTE